jgi:hypothetical protein
MKASAGAVVSLVAAALAMGCGSDSGSPPEVKDNGTCMFSGAVTGTHTCTVAGAFTLGEQVGVIEITYNLAGPDGGVTGDTLYGTIVFPSAPAPGTYTGSSPQVLAPTTVELNDDASGNGWWFTTALGDFTLVLSSVTKIGTDPDIGDVYRPSGTLDATLVPITSSTGGNVTLHATF